MARASRKRRRSGASPRRRTPAPRRSPPAPRGGPAARPPAPLRWPRWLRWPRRLPRLPPLAWVALVALGLATFNALYHLARKPSDVLSLVAPTSAKAPAGTWAAYGRLFREHATPVIRPELLAALVQVESAGDPLARTYWRWRWSWRPLELYAPASSAVGILQITDGTFAEARQLCIHDHQVARDGPWNDLSSCWFNALYFRTIPSHAIEMTSARLHQIVVDTLAAQRLARATPEQQGRLAAVVHLCGRERGVAYARRGFRPAPGERCGDHLLELYLAQVARHQATFARLAAEEE